MRSTEIQVVRSSMPALEDYVSEIAPLWESRWLTNGGEKHLLLEDRLKDYLGVSEVSLFANGHLALECAIEAMCLGRDGRRKVITTPFTFASTTHAIVRKGLEPVFADIKPDDYTIDPDRIESLVDEDTCAIVPVHVYGNVCDDLKIEKIANEYNLKVIYDAAHAFGVKKNGVSVASLGNASMFSFHATKVFHTIEGGAICSSDPALASNLKKWRNFGIADPEHVDYVGGNAKMNEFCAAMGLCNLRHVDAGIAKRKALAERYWGNLGDVPGLQFCIPSEDTHHNYAYMPMVFKEEFGASRDEVHASLDAAGVKARKYFYPLTSDFGCYSRYGFDSSTTPTAQYVAARVLTMPLFPDLDLSDVDRICEVVLACR